MDYTQADVDKILKASERATQSRMYVGDIEDHAIVEGSTYGFVLYRVNPSGKVSKERRLADMTMFAGALILAEEVKRLRKENERLHEELVGLRPMEI